MEVRRPSFEVLVRDEPAVGQLLDPAELVFRRARAEGAGQTVRL